MRVGVDTGGTFTDVVAGDGRVAKVLSTPADPSVAVAEGIGALGDGRPELLAHGTTVATNALLERRGAVVALVTNEGFADIIEIARQDRPSLYDIWVDRPEPLVPRELRFEVSGRLDATGRELAAPDLDALPAIPPGVPAVAVCLLHSDLDDVHERKVADALASRGLDVTRSSAVSPEFREYERLVTTVANAYLRPACRGYLLALRDLAGEVLVMTSAGGLVPFDEAAEIPARLLLSGPAGGVLAAAATAVAAGFDDAVTLDMGGTSTDVGLVLDGRPAPAAQRSVGGFPIRLPALDIHTIGAGGGSVARLDPGGALAVGPQSAGADPGPACYGRGGAEATVTDADLVLGRIPAGSAFPGLGELSVEAARAALGRAGIPAEGVVQVVDTAMEQAVRVMTTARGIDPRGMALVAFGGAGPLHACAVADALGMVAVVVPPRAGVLSAVGLLCSPRQRDVVRSWPGLASLEGLGPAREELAGMARGLVGQGGGSASVETFLDCRYAGQSHELTVGSVDDFHEEHQRRNGYARPGTAVEVVALRARARRPAPMSPSDLPSPGDRRPVEGPAVLAEPDCTVWVPDGWHAEVGMGGAWILRRRR